MTQDQIAERLKITPSTVSRYLNLLELAPKDQDNVRTGKLPVERAVRAVQEVRAKKRKKAGRQPIDTGWEPENFSQNHILAKPASRMCEGLAHSGRRRLGGACTHCWEQAIRQDQTRRIMVEHGIQLPMPITADGRITLTGGVRGAE
jgi:hypothetical protein